MFDSVLLGRSRRTKDARNLPRTRWRQSQWHLFLFLRRPRNIVKSNDHVSILCKNVIFDSVGDSARRASGHASFHYRLRQQQRS